MILRIVELAMVYDADGGVMGETRYVVKHLFGRASCSLCDISHGRARRRPEFDDLLGRLPVPVRVLHRNEQDLELRTATSGRLPCVMGRAVDGRWEPLIDRDQLAACGGDVGRLGELVDVALRGRV